MPKNIIKNDKRQGVLVNAKMRGNVTRREMLGTEHIVVENCGSIVGDSVMNGVYYPLDEVKKLASETTGNVLAPVSHPVDASGNFVSAGSVEGIHQGYVGAFSFNYRMSGDRLVRDIAVDPEKAMQSEKGRELLRRIEEGVETDTSTGLILNIENVEGYGKDGEPYNMVASNLMLDHDAILFDEQGAATADEGVGIHTNSEGQDEEIAVASVALNASTPAMNMPMSDDEFDEVNAIQRIKDYTGSNDAPTANYRKFFMEFDKDNADKFEAYKMPFADVKEVNGKMVPHAMSKAIEAYAKDDAYNTYDERAKNAIDKYARDMDESMPASDEKKGMLNSLKSILSKFMRVLENNEGVDYNTFEQVANAADKDVNLNLKQQEDRIMRDLIINKLKEAGVDVDFDGMDESQLLAAYNEQLTAEGESNDQVDIESAVANAVASAVEPLTQKIEQLEAEASSKEEAALNSLAETVEGLNIGINKDQAKALGADGMKSIIDRNGGAVAFNSAGGAPNTGADDDYEMPSLG